MPDLPPHVPVVIVGAGQAGLSVSKHLTEAGVEHVLLEADRVASSWASRRWDSFCLVTPNRQCTLPGFAYSGDDPHGFMARDEIVEYVERFAGSFDAPVLTGVTVERLTRRTPWAIDGSTGGFTLETSAGTLDADQVLIATGGYHTPRVPDEASELPAEVVQLHSNDYRHPGQFGDPDGAVLVVGTGQSGTQIAEDLLLAGRDVHLCVGNAPRAPRRHRGRDVVDWLEDMGHYDTPVERYPTGDRDRLRAKTNHYVTGRGGGRDIDLRDFALRGMKLHGRMTGLEGGRITVADDLAKNLDAADATYNRILDSIDEHVEELGIDAPPGGRYRPVWEPPAIEEAESDGIDLAAAGISGVVWCTGFGTDYGWVEAPVFRGPAGAQKPVHRRGVTGVPGLFFIGLPWLHTWGSARFSGVARDAAFLADLLVARHRHAEAAPASERALALA